MGKYLLDFWLDGYENEEEREKAELEFIYDQLNFTASSVKITPISSTDEGEKAKTNRTYEAREVNKLKNLKEDLLSISTYFSVAKGHFKNAEQEIDFLLDSINELIQKYDSDK